MAKKTAKKKSQAKIKSEGAKSDARVRIDLRFDQPVYDGMTKLASDAGVSLNRLMEELSKWAIEYGHKGEMHRRQEDNAVVIEQRDNVISFGRMPTWQHHPDHDNYDEASLLDYPGSIYGILDFNPKVVQRGD